MHSLLRPNGGLIALVFFLGVGLGCGSSENGDANDVRPRYDWLLQGGTVVDGTGRPADSADVLVRADTIADVGRVDPDTIDVRHTFDASGLHVSPGFIDPHAHGDPTETPAFRNFLAMGVTTIVLGQDGTSPEANAFANRLEAVDQARPSVNVAYLAGHSTLRIEAGMGYERSTEETRTTLRTLVERALRAGAFGLSLGLEYDPGTHASMPELVAVAEPVAAHNGIVMSHMRSEKAGQIEAALAELLEQGRRSGAHVHVSHLKVAESDDPKTATQVLDRLAEARREGLTVTADLYPYTASYTGLSILFPSWARAPNDYDTVRRERTDELKAFLEERVQARNGPDAMLFGSGPWAGRTLQEVAERSGQSFADVLVGLGPTGGEAAYFVMDEAVMEQFLAAPHTVVSSDGSPTMQHPRGYGSFARVLARYTGSDELLSLEQAVHKMTGRTAQLLGLDDSTRARGPRGLVREGFAADLVAFHPDSVQDRATYEAPHQYARGMQGVWVNGRLTWTVDTLVAGDGAGAVLQAPSAEDP